VIVGGQHHHDLVLAGRQAVEAQLAGSVRVTPVTFTDTVAADRALFFSGLTSVAVSAALSGGWAQTPAPASKAAASAPVAVIPLMGLLLFSGFVQ